MTVSRPAWKATVIIGTSCLTYTSAYLAQLFVPMQVIFLLALASVAAALASWTVLVAYCVRKRLSNIWEGLLVPATVAVAIGVELLTGPVQVAGARLYLATHAEELNTLVTGLIADYDLRSEPGPWNVEARSASPAMERRAPPRAIAERGFVLAEVSYSYVALAHSGFQGSYLGLLYSRPGRRRTSEGDPLFISEVSRIKQLDDAWYLIVTR